MVEMSSIYNETTVCYGRLKVTKESIQSVIKKHVYVNDCMEDTTNGKSTYRMCFYVDGDINAAVTALRDVWFEQPIIIKTDNCTKIEVIAV